MTNNARGNNFINAPPARAMNPEARLFFPLGARTHRGFFSLREEAPLVFGNDDSVDYREDLRAKLESLLARFANIGVAGELSYSTTSER